MSSFSPRRLRDWLAARRHRTGPLYRFRARAAVRRRKREERERRRRMVLGILAWGFAGGTIAVVGAAWLFSDSVELLPRQRFKRLPADHPNTPRTPGDHPLSPRPN